MLTVIMRNVTCNLRKYCLDILFMKCDRVTDNVDSNVGNKNTQLGIGRSGCVNHIQEIPNLRG